MLKAFFIAGGRAAPIANDVTDFRYRAGSVELPVGALVCAQVVDGLETQFVVALGTVEFMIGGATEIASAGDFARVPPGVVHAFRNAGDETAIVLKRRISPKPVEHALSITIDFAA